MKRLLPVFAISVLFPLLSFSQCSTTNATTCVCPSGTVCDLLPDISVSKDALTNSGGYTEYAQTNAGTSQSGQGADDGRIRITGATPNIGYGPMEVHGISKWVCGTDTFTSYPGSGGCTDGSDPKQIAVQRIYHKNGNTMTYTDRETGTMTYHYSHSHVHVDDWGIYTLRIENPSDPNPLNWSIVGTGAKLAFCLLDLSNCNNSNGFCRDSLNNILTSSNLPNYGLGGGMYGCSNTLEGISAGYVDIYSKSLDGMWINIPNDVCNGNYWIVVQIDPRNYFTELRETNNVIAVPVTLTRQNAPGTGVAKITSNRPTTIATGDATTLTATAGYSYLWSTGATTQSIIVSASGSYTVTVNGVCGTATSSAFVLNVIAAPATPTTTSASRCGPGSVSLSASGSGTLNWFTQSSGGISVNTGNSYNTPIISTTTNYYVESRVTTTGATYFNTPHDSVLTGGSNYSSTTVQYQVFTALSPFTLKTVKVYASSSGNRTFQLLDKNSAIQRQLTISVPAGMSRVTLNFAVNTGDNYRLQVTGAPNLYKNTSSNVHYPYNIDGVCSITNSSGGHTSYYFFYDWEIKVPDLITKSSRTVVTATINTNPTVTFSGLGSTYLSTASAVTMTGLPAGGTFSGTGVSGNQFIPSVAGVGGPYSITYSYTDLNGCSGFQTQQVTVTAPPFNCLLPSALTTTAITNVSAQLNWSSAATADSFMVKYAVHLTSNYLYKKILGIPNVVSTSVTGLLPNTQYDWWVRSICVGQAGSSYQTIAATFTTLSTPVSCIVPYGLGATSITNISAVATWSIYVAADTFRVRYSVFGTTNYLYKDINGSLVSSTTLSGLLPNTTYQFQVSSKCLGVVGAYSVSYSFTTLNTAIACITPYGLSTTNIAGNSAVVNWTPLVSADSFLVKYWINGTTNYLYKKISGAGGAFNTQLTGLTSSTTYKWQVRSICTGTAATAYSSVATFATSLIRFASEENNVFNEFTLYPNPADGIINIAFNSLNQLTGKIIVHDVTGREIISRYININEGNNHVVIDLVDKAKGVYVIFVDTPLETKQIKVVLD